jgi:hypothetical protein
LTVLNHDDDDAKEIANHHSLLEKMLKHQREVQNVHLCDREEVECCVKVEGERVQETEKLEQRFLSAKNVHRNRGCG